MAGPEEDFWPEDIAKTEMVTPVSMMRAQAAILGQKTNNQLTASVQPISGAPPHFVWSFQITSPSLGGYRYEIFRVQHPLTLYPAVFMWEGHANTTVQDDRSFKDFLKQIIGSDQTKKIVQALLAQIVR